MTSDNELLSISPRTKVILRWIAVFPAAIAAYIGVAAFLTIFLQFWEGAFEFYTQLVTAIFASSAFVYAGTKTAPTNRLVTAITLTVLHAIILAAGLGFIAFGSLILKMEFKTPVWWDTVRAVVGVVATIVACRAIAKDKRNYE